MPLMPWRRAFERHGVTLKYPSRSWGGVREEDGAVVFAIRADDVLVDEEGCRCLLWSPRPGTGRPWAEGPAGRERLRQCRLAESRGEAWGLVWQGGRHGLDAESAIPLRIGCEGGEYWAYWSGVPRAFEAASLRLFANVGAKRPATLQAGNYERR